MKNPITSLSIVALLFVVFSCGQSHHDGSAAFDLANAKTEIEASNKNFAELAAKGDTVGLAALYTVDAKFLGASAPAIVGRKNIQTALSAFLQAGASKFEFKTLGVWGTPDMLAEEGEVVVSNKEGYMVEKGKYIVLWKKEDGQWKLFRDMSNSDLPLSAAE